MTDFNFPVRSFSDCSISLNLPGLPFPQPKMTPSCRFRKVWKFSFVGFQTISLPLSWKNKYDELDRRLSESIAEALSFSINLVLMIIFTQSAFIEITNYYGEIIICLNGPLTGTIASTAPVSVLSSHRVD